MKMTKTFFTANEAMTLVKVLYSKFSVSLNKAGNIKVTYLREISRSHFGKITYGFWVLHKYADGKFLWRRHNSKGYCYPLNMSGRKFEGKVIKHRNAETGHIEYWGYKPYNVKMSTFDTFDEAIEYFVNYLKKYKGIEL